MTLRRLAALPAAVAGFGWLPALAAAAAERPVWLEARPGASARVDAAPWFVSDEPEAALTERAGSSARDFTADATRPEDVVYEPIGVRVRIEGLLAGGRIVRVRGLAGRWEAFAPLDRLVPEIPAGTHLRVAGGFGGFADFYPTLRTTPEHALEIATATDLAALGMGAAPFDPHEPAFVRVRVRVTSGRLKGRAGWVGAAYTGVATASLPAGAAVAERACSCLLIQFGPP